MVKKKRKKKSSSTGSSLVKYGDFTEEEAEEESEDLASSRGGVIYKWQLGKNVLRVLPPLPGKKWRLRIYEHLINIPGTGWVSFVCPRLAEKAFCPACSKADQLNRGGSKVDMKMAKDLRPRRNSYANAIIRKDEAAGPKVINFGPQIEEQLLEMRKDPDLGGNFVHPVQGFDIVVRKKGEKINTEYKVYASNKGKVCPLHADANVMNQWIESQHPLERFGKVLTADQIEAKLRGEEIDDDEEERPRSKKGKSRKSIDEELDAIEDADWEDYEDEDDDED